MSESRAATLIDAPRIERPAPIANLRRPSLWIWGPWVWLFIISTRSVEIWLHGGLRADVTGVDPDVSGSPSDRAIMTLLIIVSLFVLGSRAERTKEILRRNKWLIVLFVYMALSVIWSNFPSISFRRCIRSMGTLVMVLVVLTEPDPLGAARALLRRVYLLHIPLSIAAIKYFRNIGVAYNWSGQEEMWVGLTNHKNNLGQVAMCSGLFSSWQVFQNWAKKKLTLDLLLLVLSLWLLRGSKNSHSSTAIVGFIVSVAVLIALQFVRKRPARAKRIILAGTIALMLFTSLAYMMFQAFDTSPVSMVLDATGRDLTFTDRTLLWTDILHNAEKNPVLGVGFGAFWVGHVGYNMYPLPNWSSKTPEWRPGEGHNGYIDVYVDLGVIGAVLVLIVIGSALAGALDDLQSRFEVGSLRLVLLLSILINNMTESSLLNGTQSLWFLFLLVAVNVPQQFRGALKNGDAIQDHLSNRHEQPHERGGSRFLHSPAPRTGH